MNSTLRKIINTYCHRQGVQYGLNLRDDMLNRATVMWEEDKSSAEIVRALGIEVPPGIFDSTPII